MYAHEQGIVHDFDALQELGIPPQLLCKQCLLFRPKLQYPPAIHPVDIFEHRLWVGLGLVLGVLAPIRRSFQVICFVYVVLRWKEIVHDDKVDFASPRELDSVQAVEPG